MSEKYNAIMEQVIVTPEMRARIIDNLGLPPTARRPAFWRLTGRYRSYAAAAACLLLVMAGAFLVTRFSRQSVEPTTPDETVYTPWGSVTYDSGAALSAAVGFDIADLPNLPFVPTETVYQKYDGDLAEIMYSDGSQTLSYRISKGSEDNSGDYNEYETTYTKTINGFSMTLEGNGTLIYKAVYQQGGYSYSITASKGLTEQQLMQMLGE